MAGILKVGYTTGDVIDRIRQLNTTGVPTPFEIGATFVVNNPEDCEKRIHLLLEKNRVNQNREFFQLSLKDVLNMSFQVILEHMADEIKEDSNKKKNDMEKLGLDKDQIFALQMLSEKYSRHEGMTTQSMTRLGHWADELVLEYKLTLMKERGLVEEHKGGRDYANSWKITSFGVKFMFENNLILNQLLNEGT